MPFVDLITNNQTLAFEYDAGRFKVLNGKFRPILNDVQIGTLLDSPVNSKPLEDIVREGERVLFVVPDSSRSSGAGQVINLVVRRLIANGTMPFDMAVLFANAAREPVTEEEKKIILTPFIAQRLVTYSHDHRDLSRLVTVGETSTGDRITINRILTEFEHVVTIAEIRFDYFSGFTGGNELICPGAAASETIAYINRVRSGVAWQRINQNFQTALNGTNPVLRAIAECSASLSLTFSVHTQVNSEGALTGLFCGDGKRSFIAAQKELISTNLLKISEKRDCVIISGIESADSSAVGLSSAAEICKEGGMIYLLLESFEQQLANKNYAARLSEILKSKAVTIVSADKNAEHLGAGVDQIGFDDLIRKTADQNGYIIPNGGKYLFDVELD